MAVSVTSTEAQDGPVTTGFWALTLGSIGVVFGDIGTSPLYAFREAVAGAAQGQPITRAIVLGVLSLILWALFIVVTAKYVLLLLRADNNGEGGTLSLMALGQRALGRRSWPLLAMGVVGASKPRRRRASTWPSGSGWKPSVTNLRPFGCASVSWNLRTSRRRW
jgi:KUP system potassium uptake protein